MEQWVTVSLLLCTFGLLREIRPSEPYVTEFILGPWRNITKETLNEEVYPVSTYSYLGLLVVIFLITDYFKYKPLIIVSGLSGILVYCILLWTESLKWLQISQVFYALYMATEVAYYSYMFAKVDKEKYKQTSSYSRSSALFGKFISGTLGQLLISFNLLDYRQLNYITLASQITATTWALFLPPITKTVYFHTEVEDLTLSDNHKNDSIVKINDMNGGHSQPTDKLNTVEKFLSAEEEVNSSWLIWKHIRSAYTQMFVVAWSAWYASSTAGYTQVQSYIQLMYKEIDPIDGNKYNGAIKAIITISGSGAALVAGLYKFKNPNVYNIFPTFAAGFQTVLVLIISSATNTWICYSCYVAFSISYHFMITIASFQIAKGLVYNNCFGLIFGINTLAAVMIQSLLTLIVITGLHFKIRQQYQFYIGYFAFLSIIGLVIWIVSFCIERKKCAVRNENVDIENDTQN